MKPTFSSRDVTKISSELCNSYANRPSMFNAEDDVVKAVGGIKLDSTRARSGCKGNVVDFLLEKNSELIPVECKTTTVSLQMKNDKSFLDKIDSGGLQISECSSTVSGSGALTALVEDYRKVAKTTKSVLEKSTILLIIKHEVDETRYVQLHSLNFWNIISYCLSKKNVTWVGNKLYDNRTFLQLMQYSKGGGRTVLSLHRSAFLQFESKLLKEMNMPFPRLRLWNPVTKA